MESILNWFGENKWITDIAAYLIAISAIIAANIKFPKWLSWIKPLVDMLAQNYGKAKNVK